MKGNSSLSNFSYFFLYQLTNMCFQLLVLPLIINSSDAPSIATYFICLSVSTLLSLFVNFGTNVTAVVELQNSSNQNDNSLHRDIYSQTFHVRLLPLLISLCIGFLLFLFTPGSYFFLFALIPVFADFFSPVFYLLFKNHLQSLFQYNLILKGFTFSWIVVFRENDFLPQLVLAAQGIAALILHAILLFQISKKFNLFPSLKFSAGTLQRTFEFAPVVGNNLITHLQQSVFLYSLPAITTPLFVAAYGFIDKIVGSIRMLVNTYNTSYFPKANIEYLKGIEHWKTTRMLQNRFITLIALVVAILFFLFPHYLMQLLMMGGTEKSASFMKTGAELIRAICLVPLVISLNALNVAEVMMAKLYKQHFSAGLFILFLTIASSFLAKYTPDESLLGYYPIFIETATLFIYLLLVYNNRKNISLVG